MCLLFTYLQIIDVVEIGYIGSPGGCIDYSSSSPVKFSFACCCTPLTHYLPTVPTSGRCNPPPRFPILLGTCLKFHVVVHRSMYGIFNLERGWIQVDRRRGSYGSIFAYLPYLSNRCMCIHYHTYVLYIQNLIPQRLPTSNFPTEKFANNSVRGDRDHATHNIPNGNLATTTTTALRPNLTLDVSHFGQFGSTENQHRTQLRPRTQDLKILLEDSGE